MVISTSSSITFSALKQTETYTNLQNADMTLGLDRNKLLTSRGVKDHKIASRNMAKTKKVIQNKVNVQAIINSL